MKPDFDNVDIRATQEFPYDGNVTSDVNPSEMFIGSELEFNAMTKYFYADLTLPKKRLSSAELRTTPTAFIASSGRANRRYLRGG